MTTSTAFATTTDSRPARVAGPLDRAKELLASAIAAPISGLVPRRMVIDQLLDLRNLLRSQPVAIAVIDELLANVPGITVVESLWWHGELVRIEHLVARLEHTSD